MFEHRKLLPPDIIKALQTSTSRPAPSAAQAVLKQSIIDHLAFAKSAAERLADLAKPQVAHLHTDFIGLIKAAQNHLGKL